VKTAVLGGSFNPVHNGHILLAEETRKLGYERIIFVPASCPPHKTIDGVSDADRLAMLNLALGGFFWAQVWEGELQRGGISYTVDTIRELKRIGMVDERPGLILGDDLAGGFSDWREVNALVSEVEIILARRIGGDTPFDFPCLRLQNPIWPYSSTEVRRRISSGQISGKYLPSPVVDYIVRKGLYGSQKT
jgi:nicotinate-nucleotide adenylyltransferase